MSGSKPSDRKKPASEMEEELNQPSAMEMAQQPSKIPDEHRQFINETVKYFQKSGMSIFDAQVAAQTAEYATKGESDTVRILEAALYIATLYNQKSKEKRLFGTDLAVLGMKLSESLNKMTVNEIKFEEV